MNKAEHVKVIYRAILDAIDKGDIDLDEDILVVKRRFFTEARDKGY